jgi:hypothetical protein
MSGPPLAQREDSHQPTLRFPADKAKAVNPDTHKHPVRPHHLRQGSGIPSLHPDSLRIRALWDLAWEGHIWCSS